MSTLQWLGEDYQPIIKLTSPPPRKGVKRRSTADTTTTTTGFFSYKQTPPRVVGVCSNCLILVTSHVSLPPTWTSVPAVLRVLTATFLAPRSTSYHGSETWRLALRALCRRQCYEEHKTSCIRYYAPQVVMSLTHCPGEHLSSLSLTHCSEEHLLRDSDAVLRGAQVVLSQTQSLEEHKSSCLRHSPQRSTGRQVSVTVLKSSCLQNCFPLR